MTAPDLVSQLLLPVLQVAAILCVTSLCGYALQRLRQPRVVGEIAGGLLLGPLAFGHLFPATFAALFPATHLQALETVSNIGLVLFLFLSGAELDLATIRGNRRSTLAILLGNVGLPFALGAAVSPMLRARFGRPHVSPLGFLLFTGIAMSITALPVLARIIEERKSTRLRIDPSTATTALICAATNDLLAWSLLALALNLTHSQQPDHNLAATGLRLLALLAYLAVMLLLVRPLAKRLLVRSSSPRIAFWLPGAVAFAFLSARITEALGVHAFFGAFLAGICIPLTSSDAAPLEQAFRKTFRPITWIALPVFFAMTGLRMQPGTFSLGSMEWFALILVLAVTGKIGGAIFAARATGMQWKMSTQIGILLNTRGLVELIVLNVGYKEGVLTPLLFTLFVLMALVTTAMTVPLLDLSERWGGNDRPLEAFDDALHHSRRSKPSR
ncbi:cation:proton antiporter [Granulicella mallensis]|uniref:Sodium/hydrogen exchanger n=1 Tax=Granulicella mallensis (strain ATCC BAA-1857 / DSM 23137 / MP5ACTX8) TaxID=682795 RepID=G8NVR8_GRAMM|nr:cation:proton antiporter [Granulicella mallensis]AEU38821.1 sodium/hydrogen exchanger [Granulicella mallensis MP5ACTX8]